MQSTTNILGSPTMKDIVMRINQLRKKSGGSKSGEAYECIKCKDREYLIIRREATRPDGSTIYQDFYTECDCYEKRRVRRLFQSSRITDKFLELTFDGFTLSDRPGLVQDAFECTNAYVEDFLANSQPRMNGEAPKIWDDRKNSIALMGVPGCGKTHLLIAASNQLMENGYAVLYFPWVDGMTDLKSDFDRLNDKIQHMKTVPVLFIDDLFKGRNKPTEWQKECLFEVINYRYLNHLPIMISSEWDVDDICEVDMGIGSRIKQMCDHFTVVLRGVPGLNYRMEDE